MKATVLKFVAALVLIPLQFLMLLIVGGALQTERIIPADTGAALMSVEVFALIPMIVAISAYRTGFAWRLLAWITGVLSVVAVVALLAPMMSIAANSNWTSMILDGAFDYSAVARFIIFLVSCAVASFFPAWIICRIGRKLDITQPLKQSANRAPTF